MTQTACSVTKQILLKHPTTDLCLSQLEDGEWRLMKGPQMLVNLGRNMRPLLLLLERAQVMTPELEEAHP